MKILYIAHERAAARLAARALHGIAANVALTWAQTPGGALQWLEGNRDAAAVIIEVYAQSCAPFVEQLRGLGLTTPVLVVVASAQLEPAVAALNAGADGYAVAGPSLETDLPRIVALVLERERSRRHLLTHARTELESARERAEQQLARAEAARQQVEERSASELAAAATRLADVQDRHTAALAREARICTALQRRLFELERAVRNADERRASDAVAFADHLAKRHAEFTASLTQTAQSRDALAAQLSVATAALEEAQQLRRADAAAAVEHFHRREAELGAALAEAVAARTTLEAALATAETAHQDTRQRAASDLAAANERQAALEDLLTQEADRRRALAEQLAAAAAAHHDAERLRTTELTKAAARHAELQVRHDAALAEHAAAHAAFEQQSTEAASALERATQERASEAAAAAERLARRDAELGAQLAEAASARTALEHALSEAQSAHQDAVQRAAADLASAAERQAALDDRLTQEAERATTLERQLANAETARRDADGRHAAELEAAGTELTALQATYDAVVAEHAAARAALEGHLAGARTESARVRRRLLHVASAYRRRALEQKKELEARLAGERADAERARRATDEEIRQIQLERESLRHVLAATQDQLRRLHGTVDEDRQAYERARLTSESELQRVSAEYDQLRQAFDRLQSAFQMLEQIAGEHAAERARLESVVADRDRELSVQAERHRGAEQAGHEALAELQQTLRQTLEAGEAGMTRVQREIDALRGELDATRTRAEALRAEAERVPVLHARLELSQKEHRGAFERAPYGLCRCTPGGVILDANHSFVALIGRRQADEVRNMDLAAAVLDSAGDLDWLFERTRTIRKTEPVETTWKTRDGRDRTVRLQALATTTGTVEIVVEDITDVRALEERLRQAHRMEAVGRLASEVAVTCDALLRDAIRGVHDWTAAGGADDALRRQGERMVTELTRAASFLRQLGAYGHEQLRALEPVSVQRVLRDLAPVLKRVVGDPIELVLSRSSGSFDVDVEAERLERVLVNVAGYARERMPRGGQITIDLATWAVGRRFVAEHPNVRPGAHVLITVTGVPETGELLVDTGSSSRPCDKPGVDFGALIDLVGSSGGHLWIEAQPAGSMVVKIHLPKPAVGARGRDTRADRGGRFARWFRSSSSGAVRA